MLRPTQTIILFYSRTRNGTNINFIEAFISMLNLRFLIYMNLSHYSVSTTEMFQRKQGVINQKQRMIFPRKRFKRKKKIYQRNQKTAMRSFTSLPPRIFIWFLKCFLNHIHQPVPFYLPQKHYYFTPRSGWWLGRENEKIRDCQYFLSALKHGERTLDVEEHFPWKLNNG